MSKAFFDTNILVYACDNDTPDKQEKARNLIRRHAHGNLPCISTQVLQEFYVSATRKLGIEPHRAKDIIATARKLRCNVIYTEDLNHGQIYDSVQALNPFL